MQAVVEDDSERKVGRGAQPCAVGRHLSTRSAHGGTAAASDDVGRGEAQERHGSASAPGMGSGIGQVPTAQVEASYAGRMGVRALWRSGRRRTGGSIQ